MTAVDEFSDFEAYSIEGWDGYGASPIAPETIRAAREFARHIPKEWPADIAPGSDGSIGFEWSANGLRLMIDFGPAGAVDVRLTGRAVSSLA